MIVSQLYAVALVLTAVSGVPAVLSPIGSVGGQRTSTAILLVGCVVGLVAVGFHLFAFSPAPSISFSWALMAVGSVGADALTAFFLVPVFVLAAAGSVFGLSYWKADEHPDNSQGLPLFWGLTTAGMILLLIARNLLVFLVGWEIMALAAFFLLSADHHQRETRAAAWVYFAATHVATVLFFGVFAFLSVRTGTDAMDVISVQDVGVWGFNIIFLGLFIGFGLKAGIMPMHFWLPAAHANAPSHVSALMSGVVLKMGIYGIARFLTLFENPPVAWGGFIVVMGVISGFAGVILAIAQHDLKRLLAYHSVENIGIILMGLGLAMIGTSLNRPGLVVLGLAGALLHVWNHALFKGLLFLTAGSVVHATGTRRLDRMGGLARTMPWTAALFFIGAVAIAGLPPLNGFVSEFFLYLAFFDGGVPIAIPAVALATIGALAVACFVKAYGLTFLGASRNPVKSAVHESSVVMILPMILLASGCVVIGLVPTVISTPVEAAIRAWGGPNAMDYPLLTAVAPISTLQMMHILIVVAVLAGTAIVWHLQRKARRSLTWDCGYRFPTARMQYTPTSFARSIVQFYRWFLRPSQHDHIPDGLFPASGSIKSHVDEPVLDRALLPIARFAIRHTGRFRMAHPHTTQIYILMLFAFAALLLLLMVPFGSLMEILAGGR